MITLPQARARVLAACSPLAPRSVPIADAVGCVTAEAVQALAPVPPFTNSAMDGYAVVAADTAGAADGRPVRLRVLATASAGGALPPPVGPGQAVRIMTGAPMPPGADAVVLVERTATVGDHVDISLEVAAGTSVRPMGDDVQPGDSVLPAGLRLAPAHLGALASLGRPDVAVVPRPKVGVLSTGDELVPPGQPLGPGQIHDSNRVMLVALVQAAGATAVDLGHVPDDEAALEAVLRDGVQRCDVLVSSGGVSMGDADVVKLVLGRIADMDWMQVAIKPAKPFALGTLGGVAILGLPGNPVSSLVSFELLAAPALRRIAGFASVEPPEVLALAAADLRRRPDGKTHFARVALRWNGTGYEAGSVGAQGSHQLAASAGANGLAVLPDGDGVAAGEPVQVIPLTGTTVPVIHP